LISSKIKLNIIVIDNSSQDGTAEYIRQNFPEITLFAQNKNLGFGAANNIGIKYALCNGADYVFLLNQDAWIEENTIENLLKIFVCDITDKLPAAREACLKPVGIVSPLHLNGAGNDIDIKFIDTYLSHQNTPNFINDLYFNRLKPAYATHLVNAAALLVSRECIEKTGGFDTSLFYHYGEDWNYCQRVNYHGFKIMIAPHSVVYHDRAERHGKFTKPFENAWSKIEPALHWGNILIPESQLDNFIAKNEKKYRKTLIKFALKLKFRKIFALKKQFLDEKTFFEKIK
jgi:GT2 family glycosyltransferase